MSEIDIKDLFDTSRVTNGRRIFYLILYSPFGLVLFFLRLVIGTVLWFHGFFLPDCQIVRSFLHHAFSLLLGVFVKIHPESEARDENARIIIANSISVLDHFALYRASRTVMPSLWDLPAVVSSSVGLCKMNLRDKDHLIRNIREYISSSSSANVAIQPEFGTTNGRVALMKFNSWPFSVETLVQPVALEARRPDVLGVNLSSVSSTWWTDVFWFMFVPYTIFTLRYLKVKSNDNQKVLAREVESDIAGVLKIKTSNFTITDKFEYEKRYVIESTRNGLRSRRSMTNAPVTSEMQRMVRQVRDVLPFVPGYVIQSDLLKTGNVDVTVANLLDGVVPYTPEQRNSNSGTSTLDSAQTSRDEPKRENLSFEERKAKMIANAREKYMIKHGITDC